MGNKAEQEKATHTQLYQLLSRFLPYLSKHKYQAKINYAKKAYSNNPKRLIS
jgi:hypothetical protein